MRSIWSLANMRIGLPDKRSRLGREWREGAGKCGWGVTRSFYKKLQRFKHKGSG